MAAKYSYYTREGLKKLNDELRELKTKGRTQVSKQLAEAIEKGDLRENAEYDAAKDAQAMLELKIVKLSEIIVNSRLLDESTLDPTVVNILSKVKIKHLALGKEFEYTLVPEKEADLAQNKISVDSPIGKGLQGKKVGDIAEIEVPNGIIKFEILELGR